MDNSNWSKYVDSVNDRIYTDRKGMRTRNIVLSWYQVKDQVRAVIERGEYWDTQPMGERLLKLHNDPWKKQVWSWKCTKKRVTYRDYLGKQRYRYEQVRVPDEELASANDISEWLRNGYRTEVFENTADLVPSSMQKRPVWSEEDGDLDINRLYSGYDDFYFDMDDRPTKPGIHLQIEMAFASGVAQKTIEEFGGWVNSLIGSMEAYGIDMIIDLWIPLNDLMVDDHPDIFDDRPAQVRTNVLLRVKNANEVCDFTDWSILFSPAGYRQIGFAAKCVAGDKIRKQVTDHYGMTIGGKTWGLEYDREESIVRITVNQRAAASEAIPFESLNKQAVEHGLIPQIPEFDLRA